MKGIAFLGTDTFVQRKQRFELENRTKEWAYRYRGVSWAISIVALTISFFAYIKPSTHTQILLLPEKERIAGVPKLDTLTVWGTLYK